MNIRRIGRVTKTIGLTSLLLATFVPATRSEPSINLKTQALQKVANKTNQPASNFTLLNSVEVNHPLQRANFVEFKLLDKSGKIYGISLTQTGQEIDAKQLHANEEAAYTAKYGKLQAKLARKLEVLPANEAIPVIVWIKESAPTPKLQRPAPRSGALASAAQAREVLVQVDAKRAAEIESIVPPVANKLKRLNGNVKADKHAPALYATLTAQQIRQVAQFPEVALVYEDEINKPELEIARQTILANVVESRGFTGSGIQVAQIEVGGRIATSNPNLSGAIQDATYVCGSPSTHSTGVAGIIRSTNSTVRGISPGVSLWAGGSCNGVSSELQNRSTAAADWGARILNLSWGSDSNLVPGASDRFYDDLVINRWRTVVKSAGNRGSGCGLEGNVTSPGLGYNVITVGNVNDRNTTSWSDDTMDSCSSWKNPSSTYGDRQKPEVSAPGSNINSTTNAFPWTGNIGSGTSYAAPMVSGVAAQIMQRNSGLTVWPEAVKAILMTTAIHNIEGSAQLSEYDGAGSIAADRADDVARGVSGNWGAQSYTCDAAPTVDLSSISLTGGVRTRATIAWANDPNYASYTSKPSADLDLRVVDPSGNLVAISASWDNNSEIVDFTPSVSGTYKLQVSKYRCDYSPRWLGWAWRQGN